MTAIIVATFAVMKVIVLIASDTHLPFGRTLGIHRVARDASGDIRSGARAS
jgi:hypothetical protein